jgi:hypothetical protein
MRTIRSSSRPNCTSVAGGPRVEPFNAQPAGQTYGRWAATWWQWALGIPAAVNPLTDATGEHCAQRQVDAVWFLAGSVSPDPVVRACVIPAGKSLFFPLINTIYGAFLNDPPNTRTESFVRTAGSCTEPVQISASLDGYTVAKPTRFFTGASGSQSPIFNVQLPPGNVLGLDEIAVPELVLSPSAEQGYYFFVRPCAPVLTPSGGSRRGAPSETSRTSRTISPWSGTIRANRRAGR